MKQHPIFEDLFALISASGLISLGIFFLEKASLLSGGTAGLALVVTYLADYSFGQVFFFLNLPFYILAWFYIGPRFTFNTLISVTIISLCVDHLDQVVVIRFLEPPYTAAYAAVIAGLLTGVGMLILFRHNSSLGGVGILAVFLNKKLNLPTGAVLLFGDFLVLGASLFVLDPYHVMLSVLSAGFVSLVLMMNHKPYRYQLR
jgi:uncharacterized membrane-anchored protein YitT (DUF2179 family)